MNADLLNGLFELCGAIALSFNVRRILIDKMIKGVHWAPTIFFTSWSLWNLFYYPTFGQWWSFTGGCCIAAVNLVWLALVFWYRKPRNAP